MISDVYFIRSKKSDDNYYEQIDRIIKKTGFYDNLSEDEKVVLKVHKRDIDESNYVTNDLLEDIKDKLSNKNVSCSIIRNDTLYHSKLYMNNDDDFYNEINNCDEIIHIDNDGKNFTSLPILKKVHECDSMIVFSHFKGHSMIGFSGSLKNVATGITDLNGQIILHKLVQPFVSKIACLACNVCVKVCPEKAIIIDSVAKINADLCTGCNVCISSCPKNAIKLNKIASKRYMEGLSEFASYLNNKKDNKVLFINSLINIKPYYDCNDSTNKVLVNDIGLLASFDPAAIDKASYDLVNNDGTLNNDTSIDKFKEKWRNVDGTLQFNYAEKLKNGTQNYDLIEL